MKKEHFEVLLENMDSKIDLVLEGHSVLNKKIDDLKQENKEDHRFLQQMITEVNQKVDNLDQKVDNLDQKNEAAHATLNKKLDAREKETSGLKRRLTRLEAARA